MPFLPTIHSQKSLTSTSTFLSSSLFFSRLASSYKDLRALIISAMRFLLYSWYRMKFLGILSGSIFPSSDVTLPVCDCMRKASCAGDISFVKSLSIFSIHHRFLKQATVIVRPVSHFTCFLGVSVVLNR